MDAYGKTLLTATLLVGVTLATGATALGQQANPNPYNSGVLRLYWPGAYAWARHNIGDTVGIEDNYFTNIGGFLPLHYRPDQSIVFFEPRSLISSQDSAVANLGLGARFYDPFTRAVIGGGFWYDHDDMHFRNYKQLSSSLEILFPSWEARANLYFPVGKQRHLLAEHTTLLPLPIYEQHYMLYGWTDRQLETALSGVELEVGANIPRVEGLRAFGGYYNFQAFGLNVHGGKARLEYRINELLQASVELTTDNNFGNTGLFGVQLYLPGRRPSGEPSESPSQRLLGLTERRNHAIVDRRWTNERHYLTHTNPGAPIMVYHVDDNAGLDGDGSIEAPFGSLTDGLEAASYGDIVFVRGGTYRGSFEVGSGVRLLGDGLSNLAPHRVVAQQGTFLLPGQTASPRPVILANDSQGALRIAHPLGLPISMVEIAGFQLSNAGGTGILGYGNEGLQIHHNILSNCQEYGILLANAYGDGSFSLDTSVFTHSGIFNNTISNNGLGGAVVAHLDITGTSLLPGNWPPQLLNLVQATPRGDLALAVSGNQITGNGTTEENSSLDTEIGYKARTGLAVLTTIDSRIAVTAENNTLSNNGARGSANNLMDASGGAILASIGGGVVTADFNGNQLSGNRGYAASAVAQGAGSHVILNATSNEVTNPDYAFSVDRTGNDEWVTPASGIGLLADDGRVDATLSGNTLTGMVQPSLPQVGVGAAALGTGLVNATVNNQNAITGWTDGGVAAESHDAGSRVNLEVSRNTSINNNGRGIALGAYGGDIDAIVENNQQINHNSRGIGLQAYGEGSNIVASISGNNQINDNPEGGIAIEADGGGNVNTTIENNQQINLNGNNGIGLKAAGVGSKIVASVIGNNQISGSQQVSTINASAGIAGQAERGGVIETTIRGNSQINDHAHFGIVMLSDGEGSLVNGVIEDNGQINNNGTTHFYQLLSNSKRTSAGIAALAQDEGEVRLDVVSSNPGQQRQQISNNGNLASDTGPMDVTGGAVFAAFEGGRVTTNFNENELLRNRGLAITAAAFGMKDKPDGQQDVGSQVELNASRNVIGSAREAWIRDPRDPGDADTYASGVSLLALGDSYGTGKNDKAHVVASLAENTITEPEQDSQYRFGIRAAALFDQSLVELAASGNRISAGDYGILGDAYLPGGAGTESRLWLDLDNNRFGQAAGGSSHVKDVGINNYQDVTRVDVNFTRNVSDGGGLGFEFERYFGKGVFNYYAPAGSNNPEPTTKGGPTQVFSPIPRP